LRSSGEVMRGIPQDEPTSSPASVLTTSRNQGGTRLITSILATQVPKGAPRQRLLAHLRSRGADATELGGDAIVAHLGARRALGAFERCIDDRTPVIATISGAPGIGKTRLRREAISRIASHPAAPRIVLARCEAFAKTHALGVVADIARGLAGLPKGAVLSD